MKFTCLRSDLAEAVSNVQRAVSSKASIPALEGILIKAYGSQIVLSGYDLEIGITTAIDATVNIEGEIVVSAKLFSNIVRKLPEEIVCIETDERLITYITSGQADYQIVGISSAEYPELPTFDGLDNITVNAEVFKNMIRQTIFAVSENAMKSPIYTGSLFEINNNIFRIIAIDGYRMALREENIDFQGKVSFVVPGKTQSEVLKLITDNEKDIEIIVGQRQIIFKVENYSIISRLIEGTFLDYNSTIPKDNKTEFVINTRTLINAVERMALMTDERIQTPVRCNISSDEIKLSCSTSIGRANDVITTTVAGADVEIGFNNRYLLDALKNSDTDEVRIIVNGPLIPIVVKPVNSDSFVFLIVPMRLGNEG